ncbi:protein of unknown function [Acidithiobacillus ferrivorans]|uniref:Uncharacterized protein n=1 Tax=Acidithiobacillus ferrivorans TaxID=160808 RepID=A0A060US27_9PROT|nr:hypothetical protein AFERRI_530001 [Acidithiobacillus ferrivorans]SMH67467.1 protein of unknown function [Acidithiobacillus ferrivorans]
MEYEQEDGGRWIAEMPEIPGVVCYVMSKIGGLSEDHGASNIRGSGPAGQDRMKNNDV